MTGARSPIPSIAFTLHWPPFALYFNFYIPGLILGLGIRTKSDQYRVFGLAVSLVWILDSAILVATTVGDLLQAANPPTAIFLLTWIVFELGTLGYCIWQFNVLRSLQATCPARDSNSEPPG